MTLLGKLADALLMFWQACDSYERQIVTYVGIYLGLVMVSLVFRELRRWLARGVLEELIADVAPPPAPPAPEI